MRKRSSSLSEAASRRTGRSRPRPMPMTSSGPSTPRTLTFIVGRSGSTQPAYRDVARQHDLVAMLLGDAFQAAGDIDRVADDREVDRGTVPDAAQEQRPGVDTHADLQRPADLRFELGVDVVEREIDGAGGTQGLAAAGLDAVVLSERREQAVAHELVDPAAGIGPRRPARAGRSTLGNAGSAWRPSPRMRVGQPHPAPPARRRGEAHRAPIAATSRMTAGARWPMS